MQKIILTNQQKNTLIKHAKKDIPNESCAILFGSIDEHDTIVKDVFLTENMDSSPTNFTISNEQLIEGYRLAEEKNLDVVAIFHSHPSSDAVPSDTDKKFMHSNPVVWMIFSGISEDLRAFVLESEIIEVSIELRD